MKKIAKKKTYYKGVLGSTEKILNLLKAADGLRECVDESLSGGSKINAIKEVRGVVGEEFRLREVKDAIDRYSRYLSFSKRIDWLHKHIPTGRFIIADDRKFIQRLHGRLFNNIKALPTGEELIRANRLYREWGIPKYKKGEYV